MSGPMGSDNWPDLIGSKIAKKYLIIEELGEGSAARVYQAFDMETRGEVALKLFSLRSGQLQNTRRFLGEMKIRLEHPNIVRVLETGNDRSFLYIAMSVMTGGSLKDMLLRGQILTINKACSYATQVANGLDFAHSKGIIHRDVKPANILINGDDRERVLVADFGIARFLPDPTMTDTSTILGTPYYMSPEQSRGERVTPASDIYSLGCVLYEMLTGRPPFIAETLPALVHAHIHLIPEMVHTINPKVNQGLSLIVDRALAKLPENRYATALAFGEVLKPFARLPY